MGAFYLLWNRINFCLVNNFFHRFCFPLIQHQKHKTIDFSAFDGLALFSRLQVISPPSLISPPILKRGILYLKRACLGLWLKEWGILHSKHACFALWLIERGILHSKRIKWLPWGGYVIRAKWPVTFFSRLLHLSSLIFLALERERKTFCKISRLAAHTLNCQPISHKVRSLHLTLDYLDMPCCENLAEILCHKALRKMHRIGLGRKIGAEKLKTQD